MISCDIVTVMAERSRISVGLFSHADDASKGQGTRKTITGFLGIPTEVITTGNRSGEGTKETIEITVTERTVFDGRV